MSLTGQPFPVSMLVLDVRRFGTLTNPQQLAVRGHFYDAVTSALHLAGVPVDSCAREDRGDGMLVVLPPSVPKPVLLDGVLEHLVAALATDRAGLPDGDTKVRIAVHVGDAHHDGHGFVGADVNSTFRLVNSAPLHRAVDRTGGRCAVAVSDALYQGVVRHRYGGLDPDVYFPVAVREKETRVTAWLRTPGDDRCAADVSTAYPPEPSAPEPPPAAGGVHINAGRNSTVSRSIVAGADVTMTDGRRWWPGRSRNRSDHSR